MFVNALTRRTGTQKRLMLVDLEDFVPSDHVLRHIKSKVDFSFVYEKAKKYYAEKGRPSVDPVILVKMLLVGYMFGIQSERRLEQEIRANLVYRWFLDLELDEPVPDHSTLSQNRRRRFRGTTFFQDLFDQVVRLCIEAGLVTGRILVTDSTHIKASAADYRYEFVQVEKTPTEYMKQLDQEIERLDVQWRSGLRGN